MQIHQALSRRLTLPFLLAVTSISLVGCGHRPVQFVLVNALVEQGKPNTFPKLIKVRKDTEIIVWVAYEPGEDPRNPDTKLELVLSLPQSPFPKEVSCGGRFCISLAPNVYYTDDPKKNTYTYTGTVKAGQGPCARSSCPIDPHLEVVP